MKKQGEAKHGRKHGSIMKLESAWGGSAGEFEEFPVQNAGLVSTL